MTEDRATGECKLGVTQHELAEILTDRLDDFYRWHAGQTGAICDGQWFDHADREYYESGCGPHGPVVYRHDLERFLAGRAVVDW